MGGDTMERQVGNAMGLHFAVFYGSVRSERQGIKYARFLNAQLAARGHRVSFVDPLEIQTVAAGQDAQGVPGRRSSRPTAEAGRHHPRRHEAERGSRRESQNALLFDCESEAPQGIVDCGIGIRNSPL
jgi:hypothetical protein